MSAPSNLRAPHRHGDIAPTISRLPRIIAMAESLDELDEKLLADNVQNWEIIVMIAENYYHDGTIRLCRYTWQRLNTESEYAMPYIIRVAFALRICGKDATGAIPPLVGQRIAWFLGQPGDRKVAFEKLLDELNEKGGEYGELGWDFFRQLMLHYERELRDMKRNVARLREPSRGYIAHSKAMDEPF